MVWFQVEFHAIIIEMQSLLEYASILVLGWCHHLINDVFVIRIATVVNAFVDVDDAVASCDDASRVVVPMKANDVPFVGFHGKTFRRAKCHTYEELKVDNINAIATSIENLIDEIVDLMDANPKNATPQVALALPTVDTGVAPLDPTSEPTNNLVAPVLARQCLHQARNAGPCANTCIICDTSYFEGKSCCRSYEHNYADIVSHLMMLTGQEEEASLPAGRTMRILVNLGGEQLTALVDSGASHNIIGLDVANRFGLRVSRARVHVTVANGTSMESNGICRNIRLSIGSDTFAISSYVVHIPDVDVILGAPWLESLGAILWNFSTRVMKFRYNDREIELNGLMDDVDDATMPQSLSSPSKTLLKIDLPKAGLFNDIRREVRSEPELAAMLEGIQKGDHGYPWGVVDDIIFYNTRLYIPLWSPILVQILNGVQQLGGFALLDEVAIGIHEPSSPSTRSFPTSILLPQAIPQQSIQTCNVIMADYVGTEFLHVSGVIWQPPSMFTGPPRVFLDDSVIHTFFGMCIDHARGHDRVHTSTPTFLMFVNVFCRESKWRPFFASPPHEATISNNVRIESKDIVVPWTPIPSRSSYFQRRNRFAFNGQIGTLGFQLQLTIYSDTSNVYEHIQIGELRTLLWAMDYSIKFQARVSTRNPQLEDELCHNEDSSSKETGLANTTILPCFSPDLEDGYREGKLSSS